MGHHTETKIYQAAYGLLGVATDYMKNMPRSVKPILGAGLYVAALLAYGAGFTFAILLPWLQAYSAA